MKFRPPRIEKRKAELIPGALTLPAPYQHFVFATIMATRLRHQRRTYRRRNLGSRARSTGMMTNAADAGAGEASAEGSFGRFDGAMV